MIAEGKLPAHVPTDFGYVTDAAQKTGLEASMPLLIS
jgi:hypothetical protein